MVTYALELNLIPGGILPVVRVSQADNLSRVLNITLYNDTEVFTPSGTITLQGTTKEGTEVEESCTLTDSLVSVDIPLLDSTGTFQIAILDGEELIHTQRFIIEVEKL